MAERTNIPSSTACGQWEALLADAVDGLLNPADEAFFAAHRAVCPACTALFEDARRGREWLEFLAPEPEVPAQLLDKILAQTGPGQIEGYGLIAGSGNVLPMPAASSPISNPVWHRPGLMGLAAIQARRFAEPRLLMTAAMAFFTIALTLNLTGVRLSNLQLADLRPSMVRSLMERRLTMAYTPVIRFYDHLRFVNEVQATMRELRSATQETGESPSENNQRQKTKDTAPGESRQNPGEKFSMNPAEQAANPAHNDPNDLVETSLTLQTRPARSDGSATALWERNTPWTA
jgi:hypothetical protein